jgi:hypothetical protein
MAMLNLHSQIFTPHPAMKISRQRLAAMPGGVDTEIVRHPFTTDIYTHDKNTTKANRN